jgi:hypothetical protein
VNATATREPLEAQQRRRKATPALGPSFFTPDQSAWRKAAPKVGSTEPSSDQVNLTRVTYDQDSGRCLVQDMTATPTGWLPEPGTFGQLWDVSQ